MRFLSWTLLLTAPAFAEEVVITQKDLRFSKTEVVAKQGDKLVFRNADDFAHNLYSVSAGTTFGSHMQDAHTTIAVPVETQGEFDVKCAIHPQMKLHVKVQK
jgi:plastocyanin